MEIWRVVFRAFTFIVNSIFIKFIIEMNDERGNTICLYAIELISNRTNRTNRTNKQ